MGGATINTTRFIMTTLLTTPFHPIRPSIHIIRRRLSILTFSNINIHRNTNKQLVTCFHSHSNETNTNTNANTNTINSSFTSQQQINHPWPEWTNFLEILSNDISDNGISKDDAFLVYEQLPEHFVRAAQLCLAFARNQPNLIRLVSRRDVEAVVSNGTPFLFKNAVDTAKRLRAFLASDASNASEVEKASTIDLMKYILSYASNPTVSSESNGLYSRELVDSSIRNILHELVTVSCGARTGYVPTTSDQSSGRVTQTFRPLGRNIEMKRGDWICTKCNFMNFARNMSCLECEEPRPRKQLTGGEWECPQCTFFNYGKNMVCLKCDCKRPGTSVFNMVNSSSGSGYDGNNRPYPGQRNGGTNFSFLSPPGSSDGDSNHTPFAPLPTNKLSWGDQTSEMKEKKVLSLSKSGNQSECNVSPIIGDNTKFPRDSVTQPDKEKDQAEKSKNWFQKIAELHGVKDLSTAVSNEEFPEIMPMRKGDNQFVVSKRKDRSLTSPKYKRQVAMDQTDNTKFVPFVPFPPGYFAKKDPEQPSVPDSPVKESSETDAPTSDLKPTGSSNSHTQMSSTSHKFDNNSQTEGFSGEKPANGSLNRAESFKQTENESFRSSWTGPSLEGSAVKETDPLDMSEEAKSERWFKRVAQIKDISELSQIPDEDFPSIMPMRKGVNRFVVSKRKTPLERRLTNQQYRRNLPIVTSDPLKKENESN